MLNWVQRYGGFLAHTIAIMWHSEYQTKGIQSLENKKGSFCATFYLLMTSCMTRPANIKPKMAVMCDRVPLICAFDEHHS